MQKNNSPITSQYQISLTEWFKIIGDPKDANIIQEEDNGKHARLEFLKQTIGLPYLSTIKVEAIDLYNKTAEISTIFKKQGNSLCAIRLVPKKANLPKLRNRGMTLNKCYETWFLKQNVDFKNYHAEICPHSDVALWSMIIVVKKNEIFGEVISGHGFQLMHGDTKGRLYSFIYDFSKWQWSEENKEAFKYVKKAINDLKIKTPGQVRIIKRETGAQITNGYLEGYFEVVVLPNKKEYFNDYNRILTKYISAPNCVLEGKRSNVLSGLAAFPGKIIGKVQKVTVEDISEAKFKKNSILVTDNTDVRFLPMMKKASAILTERGSILSHASIIARELKTPCIVGIKNILNNLKDGDLIEVDAEKGVVRILK